MRNALLLSPSTFFGPYEALAASAEDGAAGSEIPVYIEAAWRRSPSRSANRPPSRFKPPVGWSTRAARDIAMVLPAGRLDADLWTDDTGRLIRFSVPPQSLEVVREDIAAVSSRSVTISRPNDEQVNIPSNGFSLAGTRVEAGAVQRPRGCRLSCSSAAAARPIATSLAVGIPILGQIAGALADAGYIVVRYDKRGVGQSGGRAEAATLTDYADDARAAVKLLADRKDVDPKRIAVVGHSEGGLVALMAAAKDKHISAVAVLATPGMYRGRLVLAQQKRLLDRSKHDAGAESRRRSRSRSRFTTR